VKLATKLPTWLVKRREDMDQFLNAQLKKLDTTRIDYYQVHGLTGKARPLSGKCSCLASWQLRV